MYANIAPSMCSSAINSRGGIPVSTATAATSQVTESRL